MAREVKPSLFLVLWVSFSVLIDCGSSRKLAENLGDEEGFEAETNPMKEKLDTPTMLAAETNRNPQISSRPQPPRYISPQIALETLSETSLITLAGTNSPVHASRILLEVRSDGSPGILSRLNPPTYAPSRAALGVISKKSPKIPSRANPHSYTPPRELCEFKVPCKNSPQIPSGRNPSGSTPPHQALLGNLSKNSPRIRSGPNPSSYIPPKTLLGVQHKNSPKPSSEADAPAFIP